MYTLYAADGSTVIMLGKKYAYCMEDTARHFDGANVSCDKLYDCGFQGIQSGWTDEYGWSLDCSWLDVTDLAPGTYVLKITVNPSRVFAEVSHDNNVGMVTVTIPSVECVISVPLKLETAVFVRAASSQNMTATAQSSAPFKLGWAFLLATLTSYVAAVMM